MGGELDLGVGFGALAEEEVEDVVGRAVAEELAEGLLVVEDAVLFDQRDEVLRGVAGEGGLGEVWVGGEEVFGAGVEVGEVASAAAGDEDLFAGPVGMIEEEGAAAATGGLDGAHKASCSGSEDEDISVLHWIKTNRRAAVRGLWDG